MYKSRQEYISAELAMYTKAKALAEDIESLLSYPPYQRAIMQAYCVDSVVENMRAQANPTLEPEIKELCLDMAGAPALLEEWLNARKQLGHAATSNILKLRNEALKDDDEDQDAFDSEEIH